MEWFFLNYLGWTIYKTTAFCGSLIFVMTAGLWVIGNITGWSEGTILGKPKKPSNQMEQDTEDNIGAGRSLFTIGLFIIGFAILISLCNL